MPRTVTPNITQAAIWPGVGGFESLSGTIGHGIRPASFVAQTIPQVTDPLAVGNLEISDGGRTLVLRDCKLDTLKGRTGSDGQTYTMVILDRRWKWQTGSISGSYNELDSRGKLVPWTIRSPKELAELCLKEAGERNYVLNLPRGLPKRVGENTDRYLRLGENFQQSFANPPVVWDNLPPMVALAQLAAKFGCRVIWQPRSDRVYVGPVGPGAALPDGPCEMIAPAVDSPETPVAVGVYGAPMRIQMRLLLEAVGEEWDGSYIPVNQLSYAPQGDGKVQISTVTWSGVTANPSVKVYITPPNGALVRFEYGDAVSAATKLARVATAINANPDLSKIMTAAAASDVLTITGKAFGVAFAVTAETSAAAPDTLTAACTQPPEGSGGDWSSCPPPHYEGVRSTARLSIDEARALARKSVFVCYRVTNIDPTNGNQGVKVPYYTNDREKFLTRRQQLILLPTKVEQVVPQPRNRNGVIPGDEEELPGLFNFLGGILPEFYNGSSRDRKAVVYGGIDWSIGNVAWDPARVGPNTPETETVRVAFSIDPVEQLVTFSEPVWRSQVLGGVMAAIAFPRLILETAVLVKFPDTSQIYRWKETQVLGGTAPTEWATREDVQVDVIGHYDEKHALLDWELPDLGQARKKGEYYLGGMASKYKVTGGETRQYIGIYPWDLDGYCQQATYSVGPGGATTTLSANCEHSDFLPDYPARQREENLPPNKQAELTNLLDQAVRDRLAPRPPGSPR